MNIATTINMAAAFRRASGLRFHMSLCLRGYCTRQHLLNSTLSSVSHKSNTDIRAQTYQQARLANTSSGFFAQSSLTGITQRVGVQLAPRGNLNVFEDSDHLPSLPVPNMSGTLERLKESISPVAMNSAELVDTLSLIDEFAKSAGPKLDLLLRTKAERTKNWLTQDWWLNEVYLKSRQALVINSNPAMIYPSLPFEVTNQRTLVGVISQLISGIIDFKLSLIHGFNPEATSIHNECRLDPNTCYNQYKNIFGSMRLPGEHSDRIESCKPVLNSDSLEKTPLSVVISYRGKFFELKLGNVEDEKVRIDKISGILDRIIASPSDDSNINNGFGVLTTANRGEWAQTFQLLDTDSMQAIQEAQFVVSIDTLPSDSMDDFCYPMLNDSPGSQRHTASLTRQILHGDSVNVGNRWFDKPVQLIIVADEKAESLLGAGINYEHSFAEGVVITKMIEHSYDKTVQNHRESSKAANFFATQQIPSQDPAAFRQLRMVDELNYGSVSAQVEKAKQNFIAQVEQFDLSYLDYHQYGSNAIKSWHFSPDSWFQVALQSAYYRMHKRLGACYESASTRRFAYGRTDTIRSLTKEVAQFCYEPRFETMQAAIRSHKAYAIAANNGEAIDRALLGYRLTYNELKAHKWSWGLPAGDDFLLKLRESSKDETCHSEQAFDVEDLFSEDELNTISAFFHNELIRRSFTYALSTSQVSSTHPNICMSYGPMRIDGYGCCYNITGQQIVAAISANSSNQFFSCEVNQLNEAIKSSLSNMRDIVEEQRLKGSNGSGN